MNCRRASILDMGMIPINGKKSQQIAKEYGVTPARVRQFALDNDLPYISFDGGKTVEFYVFDEEAEQKFANRPRKSSGRPFVQKPPKVPGKPGRPRTKPINTGPKRPVGRPRKNPHEAIMDLISKGQRGRPRKEP